MRSRGRAAIVVLAATPLLLTACDPGGSPTDSPTATASASQSPAPAETAATSDPTPDAVPDDAVLVLTGTATAGNGAVARFRLVVHAPAPFSADIAADGWTATTAWCAGEIDDPTIASQQFSFTDVDVKLTVTSGSWPAGTRLLLLPLPSEDATLAATVPLVHVDQPTLFGQASPVPHCAQPVLIEGPGSGTFYVGIRGDADGSGGVPAFHSWANRKYGLNANLPGTLGTSDVTFSGCEAEITQLGADLGAPTPQWQERFEPAFCVVGGATGGE